MRKLLAKYIPWVLIAPLIFAITTPSQFMSIAKAATITKTIIVKDSTGQLLPGALVQLQGFTAADDAVPTIYTTDAKGQVVIPIEDRWGDLELSVMPPAGDTKDALYFRNESINVTDNETYNIDLKPSNLLLNFTKPDGTPLVDSEGKAVPFHLCIPGISYLAKIYNGSNSICPAILRNGVFGVYVPKDDLIVNSLYKITVAEFYRTSAGIIYSDEYAFVKDANGNLIFYNGNAVGIVKNADSNGVYNYAVDSYNLIGTLKNSDGSSFIMPSNSWIDAIFYKLKPDGGRDTSAAVPSFSRAVITKDGKVYGRIKDNTAGNYQIMFRPDGYAGANGIPSFLVNLYQDSNGKFSLTNSNFQNTPYAFDINIPAQSDQIKFATVYPNTNTLMASSLFIRNNATGTNIAGGWTKDGNFSVAKSSIYNAGNYTVYIYGDDYRYLPNNFNLNVASPGAEPTLVSNIDATAVTKNSSGVMTLPFIEPNFSFKMTNPDGTTPKDLQVSPMICDWSDVGAWTNCNKTMYVKSSTYSGVAKLDIGTYAFRFRISANPDLASKTYKVTVASNGVIVTNELNQSINANQNNIFELAMGSSNLKFKLIDPTNSSKLLAGSTLQYCTLDANGITQLPCGDSYALDGTAGFQLADGKYEFKVLPANGQFAEKKYQITLTSGAISQSSPAIPLVGGFYQVTADTGNLKVQVTAPNGSSLPSNSTGWWDYCSNNNSGCQSGGFSFSGQANISIPDGSYIFRVRPASNSIYAVKKYSLNVISGVPSFSGLTADGSGFFKLSPATPNVTINAKMPDGTAINFINGAGIDASIWKWNLVNKNWQYFDTGGWFQSGSLNFAFNDEGTFKIQLNPRGISGVATIETNQFVVTPGLLISYNGDTPASTKSFNFNFSPPNLKLKVVNPNDSSLMSYGWVSISKVTDLLTGARYWIRNADLTPNSPGLTSASLEDGSYILEVNPPQGAQAIAGLTIRQYNLSVSGGGTVLVLKTGATFGAGTEIATDGSGNFNISPAAANIVGRILDPSGNALVNINNAWTGVSLQKLQPDGINWNWTNTPAQLNSDAFFSMRIEENGTFRVRLEPYGRSSVSITYSKPFTVTDFSTLNKNLGDITMESPSLKLRVRGANDSVDRNWVGVEVRVNGQWIDWMNTGPAGIATLKLQNPGTYQFIVNPPGDGSLPSATRKVYTGTATLANGNVTASINGVTANSDGSYTLGFGTASLSGTVLETSTATTVQNSNVVAVNMDTSQEMWEYSANTDANGHWAMNIPAGRYKIYAHAPYSNAKLANSDAIGTVTIAADGTATLSDAALSDSRTATTFVLRLNGPYWSGVITASDGTTLLKDARACLYVVVAGTGIWNCANTNINGEWGLSKPIGFTAFDSSSRLDIASNYPTSDAMQVINGVDVASVLVMNDAQRNSLKLSLQTPNTFIHVVDKDNLPAANLWVNIDRPNVGWLGGTATDANGNANFHLDLSLGFNIRVETSNNPIYSGSYAPAFTEVLASELTGKTTLKKTITLAVPNIRGIAIDPATNAPAPNTWVDIYDQTNNKWLGGSNTDLNGLFALNASATNATYSLNLNPAWNSSTISARHSYTVFVGANATDVNIKDDISGSTITPDATTKLFTLSLATPSVIGKVKDPANANGIANSWVQAFNTSLGTWANGGNSTLGGNFGIALPNGNYKIEANVPWNMGSTLARSAPCQIVVSNGSVASASGCTYAVDKSVTLNLRNPNITFIIKDSNGNPLSNAYVGLGLGSWNTGGQTGADGKVSLFVDKALAMATVKSDRNLVADPTNVENMWVWITPPYGTATAVPVNCSTGTLLCAAISPLDFGTSSDYSNADVTIKLPAPNTKIKVLANGNPASRDSWVEVFKINPSNHGWEWVGSSNTDSSGIAVFNLLDTTTASYVVRVNPSWNQRSSFSTKTYDGISGAGLLWNQIDNVTNAANAFALAIPNLRMIVKANSNTVNKWGWVSIENVDVNGNLSWVNSYGLDEIGKVSVLIPSNGKFKVTSYSGPGKPGVPTSCYVNIDNSGVVSSFESCTAGSNIATGPIGDVTITLNVGNISGKVTRASNGSGVSGAVIYANLENDFANDASAIVTSTDENGNFGLQLDPNKVWKIKVLPLTPTDGSQQLAITTTAAFTPPASGTNNIDVALAVA